MSAKIKIGIVDDEPLMQRTVKEKLSFFDELEVKLTAKNGEDLLEKLTDYRNIDVLLMDIEMPRMNGIEATRAVKAQWPQIKIIMLTVIDSDEHIFNAIKEGADGYLLKDIEPDKLYEGIVETLEGGAAMTPSVALKTLKLLRNPVDFDSIEEKEQIKLTSREQDVLEQLCSGLSASLIGDNLFISSSTVRKHVENIYAKLQVHSKLEAIQKARRNNLI